MSAIVDTLVGRENGYLSWRLNLGFLKSLATSTAAAGTEGEKHEIVMTRLRTRKE